MRENLRGIFFITKAHTVLNVTHFPTVYKFLSNPPNLLYSKIKCGVLCVVFKVL